jgi:hypothetical protein
MAAILSFFAPISGFYPGCQRCLARGNRLNNLRGEIAGISSRFQELGTLWRRQVPSEPERSLILVGLFPVCIQMPRSASRGRRMA